MNVFQKGYFPTESQGLRALHGYPLLLPIRVVVRGHTEQGSAILLWWWQLGRGGRGRTTGEELPGRSRGMIPGTC